MRVLDWPGGAWATLGTSGLRAVVLPASVAAVEGQVSTLLGMLRRANGEDSEPAPVLDLPDEARRP